MKLEMLGSVWVESKFGGRLRCVEIRGRFTLSRNSGSVCFQSEFWGALRLVEILGRSGLSRNSGAVWVESKIGHGQESEYQDDMHPFKI